MSAVEELRLCYDLLPGKAACDLMEEWPATIGWLSKFIVPANDGPVIPDRHYTYIDTEQAGRALDLGETYLSSGEQVMAKVVVSLLDRDYKFNLSELWRLSPEHRYILYRTVEKHRI